MPRLPPIAGLVAVISLLSPRVELHAQGSAASVPGAGAAADTDRFLSLYERVFARARRDPSVFGPDPLDAEHRARMAWLVGRWSCPGRVFATPTTPARVGRTPDHHDFRLDPGGPLSEVRVDSTPGGTVAYRLPRMFYDHRAALWVLASAQPGGWGVMTSPAWKGESIEFAGVMTILGSRTDLRHTWARTSDSTFTMANAEVAPDGRRIPLDEYSCVRERAELPR